MHFDNNNVYNKPYIVELLGPSGVGKTTLLNKLTTVLDGDWNYNYNYLLVEDPFSNKYKHIEDIYKLLFEKKVIEFIKNQSLYHLPELARYFAIRIQRDLWMLNRDRGKDRYMSDEGLFHYYMHDIISFMHEGKISQDDLRIIVENRLVLNLVQTKENIIKNLKVRASEIPGANNDQFSNSSLSEVERQIDSYLDTSSKIIQKIKSVDGKVFDVNIDRPLNIVIEDIKSYL